LAATGQLLFPNDPAWLPQASYVSPLTLQQLSHKQQHAKVQASKSMTPLKNARDKKKKKEKKKKKRKRDVVLTNKSIEQWA
jgi:TRAP-type C4-dicarboxylate transport system substrate-binding protein